MLGIDGFFQIGIRVILDMDIVILSKRYMDAALRGKKLRSIIELPGNVAAIRIQLPVVGQIDIRLALFIRDDPEEAKCVGFRFCGRTSGQYQYGQKRKRDDDFALDMGQKFCFHIFPP